MRILKINSLPTNRTWLDKDVIMLHACFTLLEKWVIEENGLTHCNYESHKESIDELTLLYNWWLERKKIIHSKQLEDEEDQQMIERLIKMRQFLWT